MFDFNYDTHKIGRTGFITTPHGIIETPAFIFCATKGSIKCLPTHYIDKNTQIILCNTFHLHQYTSIIKNLGIHKFMNWNKPIISDSGGFQIFSMGHGSVAEEIKGKKKSQNYLINISEEEVIFKDAFSGKKIFLSPEGSMQTQIDIGVDLAFSFDECTPANLSYEDTKKSMERSHRWERRSLEYFSRNCGNQKLYGIVQGGIYEDLRDESIKFLNSQDFFANSIGGSLGKTKEDMYKIVKYVAPKIKDRPIHLLGIGHINDLLELAPYVDTFDCVEPTRIGRHGIAILPGKRMNLRNAQFKNDFSPIDKNCQCDTCINFTRAYLNYLIKIKESSGLSLIINHNMFTMNSLMEDIRYAIKNNEFDRCKKKWYVK